MYSKFRYFAAVLTGGSEQAPRQSHANKVTGVVGMHAIFHPELFARLAVRIQHGGPQIDEIEVRLGRYVSLDHPVGLNTLWRLVPAAGPGVMLE